MGLLNEDQYLLDVIEIIDPEWEVFVQASPDATVFHHPKWSRVLALSYGYRPSVYAMKDKGGKIVAGLPVMKVDSYITGKRWVALPFSDHCCPLGLDSSYLDLFSRKLQERIRGLGESPMEIRSQLPAGTQASKDFSNYIHFLRLNGDPQTLYRGFRKKSVQYSIKKALKSGVEVRQGTDEKFLDAFYSLHLMTRKKLGVPTQPRRYFRTLFDEMISQNLGFIMLGSYGEKIIAGGVFLHFNHRLVYKYGATDPAFMNYYGNHALLWQAIRWGCQNGCKLFDWGKTEKENEGLRNFKNGWGSEEHDLTYSYIGGLTDRSPKGWKQRVLQIMIQRSPVLIGRLVGETLYRHFG